MTRKREEGGCRGGEEMEERKAGRYSRDHTAAGAASWHSLNAYNNVQWVTNLITEFNNYNCTVVA